MSVRVTGQVSAPLSDSDAVARNAAHTRPVRRDSGGSRDVLGKGRSWPSGLARDRRDAAMQVRQYALEAIEVFLLHRPCPAGLGHRPATPKTTRPLPPTQQASA